MRTLSTISMLIAPLLLISGVHAQTDVNCQLTFFHAPAGSGLTNPLRASSINRYGNIVGVDAVERPFIRYSDGRITRLQLNLPAGSSIINVGIRNASGVTVGTFRDSSNRLRGFIDHANQTTLYDYPGRTGTLLSGINRYGTIVGQFWTATTSGVFVLRNGTATPLKVPSTLGGPGAGVSSISDTGVIVGTWIYDSSNPPDLLSHGWVDVNGTFRDFSVPGSFSTTISDLNAAGVIVGGTSPWGGYIYKNGNFYRPNATLPNGTRFTPEFSGINGYGTLTGGNYVGKCDLP